MIEKAAAIIEQYKIIVELHEQLALQFQKEIDHLKEQVSNRNKLLEEAFQIMNKQLIKEI